MQETFCHSNRSDIAKRRIISCSNIIKITPYQHDFKTQRNLHKIGFYCLISFVAQISSTAYFVEYAMTSGRILFFQSEFCGANSFEENSKCISISLMSAVWSRSPFNSSLVCETLFTSDSTSESKHEIRIERHCLQNKMLSNRRLAL